MIELKGICKTKKDATVLHNVNLTINDGDVIAILGPSGMGRTALLTTILTLEKPTSGEVIIDGKKVGSKGFDYYDARKKIGMVFQDFNLFKNITVIENIMQPLVDLMGLSKQEAYERACDWLRRVGVMGKAFEYPDDLSDGEKQRVAIARTVAMDPEVILLDNPTSRLDPIMKKEVHNVIRDLAKNGSTLVLVTNEIRFAREISNRVVYFDEHTVYEEGQTSKMFESPKRDKTRQFFKQFKLLNIEIDNIDFDFIGVSSRIDVFAENLNLSPKTANSMHVAFEELVDQIVLSTIKERENFKLKTTFECDEKNGVIYFTCKYDGEEFNPLISDDDLALMIINHSLNHLNFEYVSDSDYKNVVTAQFSAKK